MGLQPTGPTRVNLEELFHPPKDLLLQCGSRQPLCVHLSGRPTIASLGCGTRPKVSTSTLHNLSSKYSIVICLLIGKSTARSWRVGCSSSDQPIMCQKRSLGNMYKNGSSLIGDYVGKHQRLTGLPFRPNAMSYGSLPQGQRGLTLSPSRLGTAGMTLSEQTNNTTLNILHGV